jgi:hypothetical protein
MHMRIDYAENRVRYRYLTKAWGTGGTTFRFAPGRASPAWLAASVQRHTSLNRVGLSSV